MTAKNSSFFDNATIAAEATIEAHAQWIWENFYREEYPSSPPQYGIARYVHGGSHIFRGGGIYFPALVNFNRRWKVASALEFTDEDLKLARIAFFFHDSAREDEGEDKWDRDSATNAYWYLIKICRIDHNKAKLLVEAMANKDMTDKEYFTLQVVDGEVVWQCVPITQEHANNGYKAYFHDPDCLDVIRARDKFRVTELKTYQNIEKLNEKDKALAFKELVLLVNEARSLIEMQGDGRETFVHQRAVGAKIKKQYEDAPDYFSKIIADLDNTEYPLPLLSQLYAGGQLLSEQELENLTLIKLNQGYDPKEGITNENLMQALNNNLVLVRGVRFSSWVFNQKSKKLGLTETVIEKEIRKTMREKGNARRSIAAIGYGNPMFSNVGFFMLNSEKIAIFSLNLIDSGTGYGNKLISESTLSVNEQQRKDFHTKVMLGGSVTEFTFGKRKVQSKHTEILCHLTDINHYDAIGFSLDPNISNDHFYENPFPIHRHAPVIEALYVQKVVEKLGRPLPLIEFSCAHHFLKIRNFTFSEVLKMWKELCEDYMKRLIAEHRMLELNALSVNEIKQKSLYGENLEIAVPYMFSITAQAPDLYEGEQQQEIDRVIGQLKSTLLAEQFNHVFSQIRERKISLIQQSAFNRTALETLVTASEVSKDIVELVYEELNSNVNVLLTLIDHDFDVKNVKWKDQQGRFNKVIKENKFKKDNAKENWSLKIAKKIMNNYFEGKPLFYYEAVAFSELTLLCRVISLYSERDKRFISLREKIRQRMLEKIENINFFMDLHGEESFCDFIIQASVCGLVSEFITKFVAYYVKDMEAEIGDKKQSIRFLSRAVVSLTHAGLFTDQFGEIKSYLLGLIKNYKLATSPYDRLTSYSGVSDFLVLFPYFNEENIQEIKPAVIEMFSKKQSSGFYGYVFSFGPENFKNYIVPAIVAFEIYTEAELLECIKGLLVSIICDSRGYFFDDPRYPLAMMYGFSDGVDFLMLLKEKLPAGTFEKSSQLREKITAILSQYHYKNFDTDIEMLLTYAKNYLKLKRARIITQVPAILLEKLEIKFEAMKANLLGHDSNEMQKLIAELSKPEPDLHLKPTSAALPTSYLLESRDSSEDGKYRALREKADNVVEEKQEEEVKEEVPVLGFN